MATKSLSIKYGVAAVVVALAIIGASLYVNNPLSSNSSNGMTSFTVMLTDPPTVPMGTSELNVTYTGIQVHVITSNGNANWMAAQESGRVNLLSLVNVTQTIASLSLPTGSTVDELQFSITSAKANVSGVVYPVTLLSQKLLIPIKSTKLNGTATSAVIDLRPTLVQINATNSTGGLVKYFVLSPTATAVIAGSVPKDHEVVGCRVNLGGKERDELEREYKRSSNNITVTSAELKVKGNSTTLTVTVKNIGKTNATLSSMTLNGKFNTTYSWSVKEQGRMGKTGTKGYGMYGENMMKYHPETLPFKVSDGKLIPIFGDDDHEGGLGNGKIVLKPGQSMTLTYSGVIQIHSDGRGKSPVVVVTPLVKESYKLRIMGTGSQTFDVVCIKG